MHRYFVQHTGENPLLQFFEGLLWRLNQAHVVRVFGQNAVMIVSQFGTIVFAPETFEIGKPLQIAQSVPSHWAKAATDSIFGTSQLAPAGLGSMRCGDVTQCSTAKWEKCFEYARLKPISARRN